MTSLPTPPAVGSALDLIGKTPMVELTEFDTGPCRLFVKLESANPGGSIKDRIARSMIEAAERDGRLKPGGTLVEATAGNTGLGLALVGAAEGLQAAAGGARQDGAREDPAPARHGRRRAHHPLGRRQGPPGVLPGHGRGAGRARFPTPSTSTSSTTPPIRWRTRPRTGPEICEQMGGDVDAVVVGVGSGGTLTGLGRFFAQGLAEDRDGAGRPGGLDPGPAGRDAASTIEAGLLGGRGHRRGLRAAQLRPRRWSTQAYAIRDAESIATARGAAHQGRHPRRLVVRHAAGRGAALLPRADRAEARRHPRLRHRHALPLQGLQRQLGDRAGPRRARAARRPARPDRPAPPTAARHRRARRHPAHRLQPHARRRRLPAAGAGRRPADRADRRERPSGSGRGPPLARRASASRSPRR